MSDADLDGWLVAIAMEPPGARCRMTNAVVLSLIRRVHRAEGREPAEISPTQTMETCDA
jgi:hypothetical protein